MTNPLTGLPAVADPDARALILGSMPGEESLRRHQYYAHPQNQFWEIMGSLFGAGRDLPYPARLQRLRTRRIALWDVVYQCLRQGSLDASIDTASVAPNDIESLLEACPGIDAIYFNGQKAEQLFKTHVKPGLLVSPICVRLPSTSAAHAALSRRGKVACWQQIRDHFERPPDT